MIKRMCGAAAALTVALAGSAQAQTWSSPIDPGRFAVGIGGGTNGGSVEAAYALNRYVVVRAQGAFLGFGLNLRSDGVDYDANLHNYTGGGLIDLHPFANPFFVSGGVVSGDRKITGDADPLITATVTVDGVGQRLSQTVPLHANIALGDTAPFAGLGFDNTFTHGGHWGFRAVAGVLFGQNPDATLTTSSAYVANPLTAPYVSSELAKLQASLQHDVDGYRYYPVAQVGVTYRF